MRHPCLRRLPVLAATCALLVFAGCAGKAHTLKVEATQFESSSLTAIDSIDNLMKAEIAAAPRSEAEASQEFVDLILGSKSELTEDHIKLALALFCAAAISRVSGNTGGRRSASRS